MEAFFGSNKKNLKVCRFGTNQGEPSISWSGFLSLPAEPVLWKLHSQDCAEVTNADLWQQQGTGKLCVEMTACVIAEDDGCVPGRGWGQVWVPQGTAAPAQPPHPPSTHPALSPSSSWACQASQHCSPSRLQPLQQGFFKEPMHLLKLILGCSFFRGAHFYISSWKLLQS